VKVVGKTNQGKRRFLERTPNWGGGHQVAPKKKKQKTSDSGARPGGVLRSNSFLQCRQKQKAADRRL